MLQLPWPVQIKIIDHLNLDDYYEVKISCKALYSLKYRPKYGPKKWFTEVFGVLYHDMTRIKTFEFNMDFLPDMILSQVQGREWFPKIIGVCARLGLVKETDQILNHPLFSRETLYE